MIRAAVISLAFALSPGLAAAQDGCTDLMEQMRFCPEGTGWQGVPIVPERNAETGQIQNHVLYGRTAVMIFSRMPQRAIDELPSRRSHADVQAAIDGLAALYGNPTELARFAPLGDTAAVASMAFHDAASGWVNLITYYAEDGHNLTIQTAQKGPTTLTDGHRDLHMQAVAALRPATGG